MFRRTGVVLAVLVAVVALSPGRAAACSCGTLGDAHPLEKADVAFTGVVARVDDPPLGGSPFKPLLNTFAVETVRKGNLGEFVVIRSGRGGGDCGVTMAVGERWSIYANRSEEDELWVNICGSSTVLATGVTPPSAPNPLVPDLGSLGPIFAVGVFTSVGLVVALLVRRRLHARESTA